MTKDEVIAMYEKLLKQILYVLDNPKDWTIKPEHLAAEIDFTLMTCENPVDEPMRTGVCETCVEKAISKLDDKTNECDELKKRLQRAELGECCESSQPGIYECAIRDSAIGCIGCRLRAAEQEAARYSIESQKHSNALSYINKLQWWRT